MRRTYLALFLLAAFAVPLAAHAQDDLITITGNGDTFTFTVPDMPGAAATPDGPDAFTLSDVPVTYNTGSGVTDESDLVYFYDSTDGGGLEDDSLTFLSAGYLGLSGDVLFTGAITSPTFNTGASGTLFTFATGGAPDYSYTITGLSATPEPSSLTLLATGLAGLGMFAAYRRRAIA